ncbi:exodeoxyribonuclease VII large subunit [Desulfocurvus sp. DL9XJH121]
MAHIFEVEELTRAVGDVLQSQFPFVWVRGQVGGVSRPASGHVYFTLRDERAQLPVVWFKSARRGVPAGGVNPATGEVMEHGFTPDVTEGANVLVAGRIAVYAERGIYQLVAELVQEEGLGELHLRFEALKADLARRGYFDQDRKMRLPASPARVALVTSPTGAAVRDFLRIAGERGTGCEVRIHPALVQGEAAPAQIAEALDAACEDGWAEVVVLLRGGGSLEDLWAFNTEPVAEAIHRATLPVLTGVGHEVDTTIADYVADARAATPSHAAQMLWPARSDLMQGLDALETRLARTGGAFLDAAGREAALWTRQLNLLSPVRRVENFLERLATATRDLGRAGAALVDQRDAALADAGRELHAAFGPLALDERSRALEALRGRLDLGAGALLRGPDRDLSLAEARLAGLDPLLPLDKGYGLVTSRRSGKFLRSVAEAAPGDELDIRVRDGRVAARVTGTQKEGK